MIQLANEGNFGFRLKSCNGYATLCRVLKILEKTYKCTIMTVKLRYMQTFAFVCTVFVLLYTMVYHGSKIFLHFTEP